MKTLVIILSLFLALNVHAVQSIVGGRLDSDLNANGKRITNGVGTFNASGFMVSANGIRNGKSSITNDGSQFGIDTSGTTTCGIQEAINSLSYATDKFHPGGGSISLSSGIFPVTTSITFSNNNIAGWKIIGTGLTSSGIVYVGTKVQNVIIVDSITGNDANLQFVMEDCFVASKTNMAASLLWLAHWGKVDVNRCLFAWWEQWTNNGAGVFGMQPGLLGDGLDVVQMNLTGIHSEPDQGDGLYVSHCNFDAVGTGIDVQCDHSRLSGNFFEACFGQACIRLRGVGLGDMISEHEHFYLGTWGYFIEAQGTSVGLSLFDVYENTGRSVVVMGVNQFKVFESENQPPTALVDSDLNETASPAPVTSVNVIFARQSDLLGSFSGNGFGLTNVQAPNLSGGQIPVGTLFQNTTNRGGYLLYTDTATLTRHRTFDASSLSNVPASQLTGTVPIANLPASIFATNIIIASNGIQIYTNASGKLVISNTAPNIALTLAAVDGVKPGIVTNVTAALVNAAVPGLLVNNVAGMTNTGSYVQVVGGFTNTVIMGNKGVTNMLQGGGNTVFITLATNGQVYISGNIVAGGGFNTTSGSMTSGSDVQTANNRYLIVPGAFELTGAAVGRPRFQRSDNDDYITRFGFGPETATVPAFFVMTNGVTTLLLANNAGSGPANWVTSGYLTSSNSFLFVPMAARPTFASLNNATNSIFEWQSNDVPPTIRNEYYDTHTNAVLKSTR